MRVRSSVPHANVIVLTSLALVVALRGLTMSPPLNVDNHHFADVPLDVLCGRNSTRIPHATQENKYQSLAVNDTQTLGVHQIYLDLFAKAKKLTSDDWDSVVFRGQRGVLIGPIAGAFRHITKALQNARRIRSILPHNSTIKIAIMLSDQIKAILENCTSNSVPEDADACRLWNGGALFDDVIIIEKDLPYKPNEANTYNSKETSGLYWMQALAGYRFAPYVETLFLDSDARPCPGFEKIFSILKPFSNQLWPMPLFKIVDLAIGIDQYRDSGAPGTPYWCPGDPRVLVDFKYYSERNTGTVLLNFHSQLARQFAHFVPLVAEHVYNNVASAPGKEVTNDQIPFLVALYLFRRLEPNFNEQILPIHTSCRTYAGIKAAGIDGDKNGMFPLMENGKHCRTCYCTPCLVTHGTSIAIQDGKMGWEEDFVFSH